MVAQDRVIVVLPPARVTGSAENVLPTGQRRPSRQPALRPLRALPDPKILPAQKTPTLFDAL